MGVEKKGHGHKHNDDERVYDINHHNQSLFPSLPLSLSLSSSK